MFSQKVSRAFLLIFVAISLLFFARGAFAQSTEATKSDGEVKYDFSEMIMTQTPHAIREMGSGISENFPAIIVLSVSIAVVISFLTHMGAEDGKGLMGDIFKIATGAFLLSMVWGANSWYSRSISPALDGLTHPDKGKYMHVDLYYISQNLSKKLGALVFPELNDSALDEFTKNVSIKTDVIIFSTNCKTVECIEKLKVYFATKNACPKDMAELMGAGYKEPETDSAWSMGAVFSYIAAKITSYLQVPVLIGIGFFIFKIIMQIFLFFNALLLTIIAQITLIVFLFTSITILFPKLFSTFKSSLITIAAISLFHFAILFINGITAIMLKNVDIGLGQVISQMAMGDSMSNVIVQSATLTVAVLVIHIAAIKMVPTIATAIASGNISGLMNLAQSISGTAAAMAITGASALGSLIPFVGGGFQYAGNSIINKMKERFWNKGGPDKPPSGGGPNAPFRGPSEGPKTQSTEAGVGASSDSQQSFQDSNGDLNRSQSKPDYSSGARASTASQEATETEGATLQRKSSGGSDGGDSSSEGGVYKPENAEHDEDGQYIFPGMMKGSLNAKEQFESNQDSKKKEQPKTKRGSVEGNISPKRKIEDTSSVAESSNGAGKVLDANERDGSKEGKRDRQKRPIDLEKQRIIRETREEAVARDVFKTANVLSVTKKVFGGAIGGAASFASEAAKAGLTNQYGAITDPLSKAQSGVKDMVSFKVKSERELALENFEKDKKKYEDLLEEGYSEEVAMSHVFKEKKKYSKTEVESKDKAADEQKMAKKRRGVLSKIWSAKNKPNKNAGDPAA